MSGCEENACKVSYFVYSLGHFQPKLTSRKTKSDAPSTRVKIPDSIFIDYITRSKQGELSQSLCITMAALRSLISMESSIRGRDWVAVVRNIEVTALWIKQYIAYVLWVFGTSNTGRNTVGDRLNEVTVDWGSTVFTNSVNSQFTLKAQLEQGVWPHSLHTMSDHIAYTQCRTTWILYGNKNIQAVVYEQDWASNWENRLDCGNECYLKLMFEECLKGAVMFPRDR